MSYTCSILCNHPASLPWNAWKCSMPLKCNTGYLKPMALCYTFHIKYGAQHPPNWRAPSKFHGLVMTAQEAR